MDISKAQCPECSKPLEVERMVCRSCGVAVEGEIEVSALGQLDLDDQVFVTAFVRGHGSIRRMESLFGISYPTVKNRLNRIVAQLDAAFTPPPSSDKSAVLDKLSRGEITLDQALEELS